MRCECSSSRPLDDDGLTITLGEPADGGSPLLVVAGEVDADNARRLQQAVIDVLRCGCHRQVTVDVAGVTVLTAAGIEALLLCQVDAGQLDCTVRLSDPSPGIYRVLQIAGLLERFGLIRPRPVEPRYPGQVGAAMGLVGSGLGG